MIGFNKVILLGNLARDPEVRYTPNGIAVTTFALAVNRKYKQGDEIKEEVSFIDIVVFGKQAENCGRYLKKGSGLLVDGRLQQRRWDDKDTGQKRSKVEVVAQTVNFMPKGSGQGSQSGATGDVPKNIADEFPDAESVGEGEISF